MTVQFVNSKLTEEFKKTGASVTKNDDQAYKSFLNPKATPEKQFYRLRLLYFSDPSNKRTIPFIEKYVHTIYERDENNKLSIEYVTCPTSPYLEVENAWKKCPICQYANKQYELAVSTDWKNKTASAAHRKMRRNFVAFIPVYVVNDPNVPENGGRVMLLNLRDRDVYTQLCDIIKATEYNQSVFNGQQAVDLAVVVQDTPQKDRKTGEIRINQKTGEPYTFKEFKFKFSDKPYDIDIPIEQVSDLGFDDSMYTYSSEQELGAFLTKHTIPADVPQDDISLDFSSDEPAPTQAQTPSTPEVPADNGFDFGADESMDAPVADVDISSDINFDMDNPAEEPATSVKEDLVSGDIDLDSVLGEFEDLNSLADIPE